APFQLLRLLPAQAGDSPPPRFRGRLPPQSPPIPNQRLDAYPLAMTPIRRREFLRQTGLSAAVLPFIVGLPSLALAAPAPPRQRLIIVFSPNGTIPPAYWPDELGVDFKLKEILSPLAGYRERMLLLRGLSNKIRGDGDGHMRGMSCLLTGIELLPGNIMG